MKRWETTTSTAMNETISKLGPVDRNVMVSSLKDRKLANTKTSILFGNEKLSYETDAMSTQRAAGLNASIEERMEQTAFIKDMKNNLTKASFCLGDDPAEYTRTSDFKKFANVICL